MTEKKQEDIQREQLKRFIRSDQLHPGKKLKSERDYRYPDRGDWRVP